ncbi:hypothetical protein HMPREF1981_02792 [Bacteroides pyogenes F0041]|uniref:Uncharacterized protein n=1 Tax=Bacteroides pyogenes F0041 TaxID=1321819 RepID=U2CD71_9BACE|nr:hypothetical protein HMPREF1981_02792 [Bacteroides pyogenes F0041]
MVPSQRQLELEALLPEYGARLSRRGVTVKTLYEEYRETHPNPCCRPCRALCRRPDVDRLCRR